MNYQPIGFEAIFAREIVQAEREKVLVLVVVFSMLATLGVVAIHVLGADISETLSRSNLRYLLPGFMLMLAGYETMYWYYLGYVIRVGKQLPSYLPYLSTLIEVSAPTILILIVAGLSNPVDALNSPPLLTYGLMMIISTMRLDAKLCLFAGLVAALEYLLLSAIFIFDGQFTDATVHGYGYYVARSILLFALGSAAALIASQIRNRVIQSLRVMDERNRVVGVFGRYVTDDIADVILNSPEGLKLGGEKRLVTLMMTDLRGFSNISENYPPEGVMAMLNNYLKEMTDIIVSFGGTIDEFIGDAILVIFGAPLSGDDDSNRAIACALAMQKRMTEVNQWNTQHEYPILEMGIGINTGEVVIGNIGSDKRSKYGVVGSHVNLTARIESYTVGGQVLTSSATLDAATADLRIDSQMTVNPKGITDSITLSEVGAIGVPYNISVPKTTSAMVRTDEKPEVRFSVLVGKDTSGEFHAAKIVQLSHHEAEMETKSKLSLHQNLRIEFPETKDYLFAKITSIEPLRVRFTFKGAQCESYIQSLLSK